MTDILSLADSLEPNVALFKGDLQKIAKIHVSFYKFYIRFASKCDALVFDKRSQDYLESCIDYLENKKLSKKGIQQSRSNCLKMLDSLNDLTVTLGCDKSMLAGMHKLIDQAVVDDEKKGDGTLDLLKQLKNLLNDPGDANDNSNDGNGNDGRISPASTGSSAPEEESTTSRGGIESMMQYLLSDSGMDTYYHKYNKDVKNFALTTEMNQIMSKAENLRENTYTGLDSLLAKMKINVPIWNYHVDRVDTIDSSNVMQNMEIFGGNKAVTDAVLYSCPDYLTVGPFDVYARGEVFVYHCLVDDCNNCMTTSVEFLKLHVKFQHGDSDVDWNCTHCELIKLHSSCQKSLDGALDHLAKHHSVKSTYTLSKERLMEINQKIIDDDDSANVCPQPKPETSSEDNLDLFHCPHEECGFSSNFMSVAFGHYTSSVDSNMIVNCRYCPLISYSTYELCEHLVREHGNANYKCGYCPYRSVSKSNCVNHQRDLHPESPNRILVLEPLPHAQYKYSCRAHNSIKPFVCNESCNFGTMVEQKFNQHILTHSGMMVTCHYCEKYHTDDMSDLRDHFLLHGIGEYQCMFCKEAFNFIAKVQTHLHQQHPSQYPYLIICQDFDTRSHSLKGKYNKVQKLELGDESLVVLPLESDKALHTINVIPESESILIEDVDHCKMQLKAFMKNKEEPEEMSYAPPMPHIEETLDLTASEDPKERVDIKPRLRVRTIEELIKSAQAPVLSDLDQPLEPVEPQYSNVATFHAFTDNDINQPGPSFTTPILTPAQIKQEMVCGAQPMTCDDEVTIEREVEGTRDPEQATAEVIPSIQIKNEVMETYRHPPNPPGKLSPKSPKKTKPKQTVNSVRVKVETADKREMQVDAPNKDTDKTREEQNAVAVLISQEGRRRSVSDGDSSRLAMNVGANQRVVNAIAEPTDSVLSAPKVAAQKVPSGSQLGTSEELPMSSVESTIEGVISNVVSLAPSLVSNLTSLPVAASDDLLPPINEIVMGSRGNKISETLVDPERKILNDPILNAASIDNVPVDFDCAVPETVDRKPIGVDSEGNLCFRPQYADPTVVDSVIISSEGEDDFDSVRASPHSTPSTSRPTTPSSGSALPTALTSSPAARPSLTKTPLSSKTATITILPKLQKISPPLEVSKSPAQQVILATGSQQKPHTYLVIEPRRSVTSVNQLPTVTMKPPSQTQVPEVEIRRYRCKLCSFFSYERSETRIHLNTAHPNRFSKLYKPSNLPFTQLVKTAPPRKMPNPDNPVKAISCPYCPELAYEVLKSFERHHAERHSDFTEAKCFLIYAAIKAPYPAQIFACPFCSHFCLKEETMWEHIYAAHAAKIANAKRPLELKCTVAMLKNVCPLYNCLDEFLDEDAFRSHVFSHTVVIACKKCTYIADSVEEFQKFHLKIDPDERIIHFYYKKSIEERANLVNVQRFSNPLYSLNVVFFREKMSILTPATSTKRKTTARKSTGAQYK